jgi:hypothetical protein
MNASEIVELFRNDFVVRDHIIPFIRTHHQRWKDVSESSLVDYLSMFFVRNTLALSLCGPKVHAVCCIKLFDRLEQWLDRWPHNPTGKFCMVDLMVAISPNAMADCFELLVNRWGPQEVVLWERMERTQEKVPRMYTWSQFEKLARRITYGLA